MAIKFFQADDGLFYVNENIVPNGYYTTYYSPDLSTVTIRSIINEKVLIPPTKLTDLQDEGGTPYTTKQAFETALRNFFVNASDGDRIPNKHIFASEAERDTYFTTNFGEIFAGLNIITAGDLQTWTGENDLTSYTPATDAVHWHSFEQPLSASEIKTLYESNTDTNALTDAKLAILNQLSLANNQITSAVSWIFPPGSVFLGDSVLESGARMISAKSNSTGNQGAFLIQLFNQNNYSKATVYDHTQTGTTFDIQTTDDTANSGTSETNVRQVVQNDVQFMRIRFKPQGGSVTQNFTFEVRLAADGLPVYSETVQPSDLSDLGGGIFELVLANPSQFDTGFNIFIKISGISLLGGNGFDGTDGVRFGDATKTNFFPWLQTFSIPINRMDIATEDFVRDHTGGMVSLHGFSIDIPSRVDVGTDLSGPKNVSFDVTNYTGITELQLQVGGSNLVALTIPTSDGQQSQTVTLPSIDTSSPTTLQSRLQANGSINSNIDSVQVRNLQPHESMYWRVDVDNSAGSFSEVGAESQEAYTGDIIIPTFTGSRYLKIATPATASDVTSILIDGVEQIGAFTLFENGVQINSVNYDVLVSNNALDGSIVSGLTVTINR